ncbi:MAG TPA: serine/threonine-protein kinase [Polyangiaceae bacterium]|nr:serine/threonine-protein kinase [Polyangiaceae bacterium]
MQLSSPTSGLQIAEQAIDMPFAPGDLIAGKYEVIKLIGSGGMGYVVSAMHVELGEVVALKFLRPEALQIEELVERFAREARAAAKIRSEHVARVFDVGVLPDGVPFIVMEHLAGQDLADVLQERGPLPVKVAVEYVMQACEALAAAHASGVVHRDIKPENLFLTKHAQGLDFIKILDFGISKVALAPGGKRGFVRTMMPLGSPVYMSPEQIRSSDQVDARTDIWSLGCVLFELLTGTVAFNEPSLMQLSAAILEHDPVPLRELVEDAPPELEEVILRCLEKDVNNRYSNIAELAIALYPFAPRRSRISAERCYHALKNAGLECPEFEVEIQSVYPPSNGEQAVPASGHRMTGAMTGRGLRTSARRTGQAVVNNEELETIRPSKKYKVAGVLALIAATAVGAFLFAQHRAGNVLGTTVAAAPANPANGAQAAPTAKPGTVIDLDALTPAVVPGGAAASGAASATRSQQRSGTSLRRAPSAPIAPLRPGVAPRKQVDEVDVGY